MADTVGIPEDVLRRAVRRLDARKRRRRLLVAAAGVSVVAVGGTALLFAARPARRNAPLAPSTALPTPAVADGCRAELAHIDFKTGIEHVLETRVTCSAEGDPYLVSFEPGGYWVGTSRARPSARPRRALRAQVFAGFFSEISIL